MNWEKRRASTLTITNMKTQRLKKVLKPLIKECIKEIIFEDGVLSSIIREAQGTSTGAPVIKESRKQRKPPSITPKRKEPLKLNENRVAMRKAIAEKLGNFDPFEGTLALTEAQAQGDSAGDPMANVDPSDVGTDISNIPGFRKWAAITERLK